MATEKPFTFNTRTDATSRTNAWVNRAGVVLDPDPVFGDHAQQNQPGVHVPPTRQEHLLMPPELHALLQNGKLTLSLVQVSTIQFNPFTIRVFLETINPYMYLSMPQQCNFEAHTSVCRVDMVELSSAPT